MPNAYGIRTRGIIVPIGPSIAYVPLTRGYFALIESDDVGRVGIHNWCASEKTTGVYATRRGGVYLHRFLSNPNAERVDHKNGRTLDNRKRGNLRPCIHRDNLRNRGIQKNNTSGHSGISWQSNAWKVEIWVGPEMKLYLGRFKSFEKAVEVRKSAEVEHFGEFSYQGVAIANIEPKAPHTNAVPSS